MFYKHATYQILKTKFNYFETKFNLGGIKSSSEDASSYLGNPRMDIISGKGVQLICDSGIERFWVEKLIF